MDADFSLAPSARFPGVATIIALLGIVTSLLPGVPAAQAQIIGTPLPGATRLELATVIGGEVYHKSSDNNGNSWSSWSDIATVIAFGNFSPTGTPALVSDGTGRLNAFALSLSNPSNPSSFNGIWSNLSTSDINFSWGGWRQVPGQDPTTGQVCIASKGCFVPVSSPAVASQGGQDAPYGAFRGMDLFVIGKSQSPGGGNALLHTWAGDTPLVGTWEVLGTGPMHGAPAVASWGPGRLDVFVQGALGGNELDHIWFANGQWSSGWENLGGILTSPPVVASPGSGRLNIFTRGTDGHLWGIWFAGGWGGWGDVGCCLAGDVTNSVAAISQAQLTLDVFVIGTLHDLYRKAYYNGGWAGWQYLDPPTFTNIAATTWVPIAPLTLAPVAVPNLLSLSQSSATSAITGLGLVSSVSFSKACIEPGDVIAQAPSAQTLVAQGSTVHITVDSGTRQTCILK
jgi:hypothetical protein